MPVGWHGLAGAGLAGDLWQHYACGPCKTLCTAAPTVMDKLPSPRGPPQHVWHTLGAGCACSPCCALSVHCAHRRNLTGAGLSGTLPPDVGWPLPDSLTTLELGQNTLRGEWAGLRGGWPNGGQRGGPKASSNAPTSRMQQHAGWAGAQTALSLWLTRHVHAGTIPANWTLPPKLKILYIW